MDEGLIKSVLPQIELLIKRLVSVIFLGVYLNPIEPKFED